MPRVAVNVSQEDLGKEGVLPVFIRARDDTGNDTERKHKINTPIVRRVLTPGNRRYGM